MLRRPPRPPLPPSAHDVLREARLLRALEGTAARVPRVLAACEDDGRHRRAVLRDGAWCEGTVVTTAVPAPLDAEPERRRIGRRAGRRARGDPRRRLARRGPRGLRQARPATSSASCGASAGCGSTTRRASCRALERVSRLAGRAPAGVAGGDDRPRRLSARQRRCSPPGRRRGSRRSSTGSSRRSATRSPTSATWSATWAQAGDPDFEVAPARRHPPTRLPHPRRADRALRGRPPGARCPTCAGTRRSRSGSRRSSSRAPTSAAWPARPTTRSSTCSSAACRSSPSARLGRRPQLADAPRRVSAACWSTTAAC